MSEHFALAQTYELNMLASAIGRFAVPNVDRETAHQANTLMDIAIQRLSEGEAPAVPYTMPELIKQAVVFDEKLANQLQRGPAGELASRSSLAAARSIIATHLEVCRNFLLKKAPQEQLVEPEAIARRYGLPAMWRDAASTLDAEVATWGIDIQHPTVPPYLAERVSKDETQEITRIIWKDVIKIDDELDADIYITNAEKDYHLFWSATADGLDYATPAAYDRATQLSFDLPHNVAHLAHLSVIAKTEGAYRFTDSMEERAYFEAVAVLAEYVMAQVCGNHPDSIEEVAAAYGMTTQESSIVALSRWITDDRKYEFKLRAARLYADMLTIQGAPFTEIVNEVSKKLGLPEDAAIAEAQKYLPWTGLGAVYTMGYRTLLGAGISTVSGAIRKNNDPITTWSQFNDECHAGFPAAA